jgi:predicted nucleic acid-binding protein
MRFLDTNILLYAVSKDPTEVRKAGKARALLQERDCALSVQVLQEFYVQATRASRPDPLTHEQATAMIEAWLRFPVQPLTVPIMQAALATRARYQLAYWDAAIVEAARAAGCTELCSEDFAAGMDFDGIVVVNPFA